jgi:hypothetical protein
MAVITHKRPNVGPRNFRGTHETKSQMSIKKTMFREKGYRDDNNCWRNIKETDMAEGY